MNSFVIFLIQYRSIHDYLKVGYTIDSLPHKQHWLQFLSNSNLKLDNSFVFLSWFINSIRNAFIKKKSFFINWSWGKKNVRLHSDLSYMLVHTKFISPIIIQWAIGHVFMALNVMTVENVLGLLCFDYITWPQPHQ